MKTGLCIVRGFLWSVLIAGVYTGEQVGAQQFDGKVISRLEYFVDVDPGEGEGESVELEAGNTTSTSATFVPNLDGLGPGKHSLYVRSQDSRGEWSMPVQHSFVISQFASVHQSLLVAGEYFFGNDPGVGKGTPFEVGQGAVEVPIELVVPQEQFGAGSQQMTVRMQDLNGTWGLPATFTSFRLPSYPVTRVDWSINHERELLASGAETVDPPLTEFLLDLMPGLIGEPGIIDKELTLRAGLLLLGRIPTAIQEFRFVIRSGEEMGNDRDGDGLIDAVETNTGRFVSAIDTGTDPDNPDSDGDGISDGIEVNTPLDPNMEDQNLIEYFAERTRHLNLGTPVLHREQDGDFTLRVKLFQSEDLTTWLAIELPPESVGVEEESVTIALPNDGGNSLFYLLQPQIE